MKIRKKKIKNRSRIAFLEKRIKRLEQRTVIQNKLNNEIVSFIKFTAGSDFKERTINSFENVSNVFTAQRELNDLVGKELDRTHRLFIFTWLMIIILGVTYVIS